MAQTFVGSNNINLFVPSGQFGTRLQGGKDSASERYIYTYLNKLTRLIFNENDDKILTYLDDDGVSVEPIYYTPIIPMLLVNGSKGIGTGFSTDIMCYNVNDIITYLKNKLNGIYDEQLKIRPYYEGFNGTIVEISDNKYLIKGLYQVIDENAIRVTELPVGLWTEDFKEHLENLIENLSTKPDKDGAIKNKKLPSVKDYKDLSTDITIDIIISFNNGILENLLSTAYDNNCNGLEKLLKLYTTQSMTNMHAFDYEEKLKKYENPKEIIDDYYPVRYTFYQKRKTIQVAEIEKELILLRNRAKYIQEILDNTLELRKKKKDEIINLLKEKKYDIIDDDDEYKYLLKMPMDSVTDENIEKIMNTHTSKIAELNIILNKTIEETWIEELDILREEYMKALLPDISAIPSISKMPKKRAVKMKVVK